MSTPIAIATYFVIWWITLLAVLPFGVRSQKESGVDIEPGTDPGAPVVHAVWRKFLWTTLVASIIFGALYFCYTNDLLPIEFIKRISNPPHQ
jgi:predicted secreted protein